MENNAASMNGNLKRKDLDEHNGGEKPFIQMRWLLAFFGFWCYSLTFMAKNAFGIALVAMVNSTVAENSTSNYGDVCERAINNTADGSSTTDGEFYWSSATQGQLLGAYIYGLMISRFFGGRLGELFGQRLVVAIAITSAGIFSLLCPVVAKIGPYPLFAIRFLLGCCSGPEFTSIQSLLSRWAPRKQLASMMSLIVAGVSFGGMFGTVTAALIAENWGWQWIFYSEGVLHLIFVPIWIIFVRNDPKDHPFITPYENRILSENKNVVTKKTVPWLKIVTSPYVYVCIVAQFSRSWLDSVQNGYGPTYFNKKIGLSLNTSSWVMGTTSLIQIPFILLFGTISDTLIRREYVTKLKTRKIMHFIGTGVPVLLYVGLALLGCNVLFISILWIITGVSIAATCSSLNVSMIDFAPNYAGTVMGIIGIGALGGTVSPMVVSALIGQLNGWNKVFYTCSGASLMSCVIYIFFITDKPQSWNYDKEKIASRPTSKDTSISKISLESTRDSIDDQYSTYM